MVLIVSGPAWDGDGEEATRDQGGKVDSLGCRQDSHKISGGSALCLAPLATWGGRLRQLRDGFAFAFTCFQVACLLACLAGQGRADDTHVAGSADR